MKTNKIVFVAGMLVFLLLGVRGFGQSATSPGGSGLSHPGDARGTEVGDHASQQLPSAEGNAKLQNPAPWKEIQPSVSLVKRSVFLTLSPEKQQTILSNPGQYKVVDDKEMEPKGITQDTGPSAASNASMTKVPAYVPEGPSKVDAAVYQTLSAEKQATIQANPDKYVVVPSGKSTK